ncbi:MAG: polysaccharide biosynthesis/export family protein [Phycisphaerales bacterium]|nr:MAG: polysaccharide biosynthesis/export family protein [Phycisphaerales bacterium]
MNSIRKAGLALLVINLGLSSAGCGNKLLDPTQIGRFRPTPAVNVILDSLGVAEERPVAWENGEEPQPQDIIAVRGDYALRSGDLVRISIFELFQEGAATVNDYLVSETGKISIPEVGVVQAAGLTETQLEEEIRQILSPAILKDPSVTVTLLNSQQRTYSILGNGVPQPGRYAIPRYDFRLTDALATAGGPMQFNVSHIYVARAQEKAGAAPGVEPSQPGFQELRLIEPGASTNSSVEAPMVTRPTNALRTISPREIPEPSEPAERYELEREMLEMIAPSAKANPPDREKVTREFVTPQQQRSISASVMPPGFRLVAPPKDAGSRQAQPQERIITPSEFGGDESREAAGPAAPPPGRIEWVFRNGKWIPLAVESGEAADAQRAATDAVQAEQPTERPAEQDMGGQIEWVRRDGQWVPVRKGAPQQPIPLPPPREALPPTTRAPLPREAEWEEAVQTRLLKIPADKLMAGDPRYNIVIKPGDTVYVPVDIIGEFCITGNVNRSGFIGITGRPMTLKMAIAAAGGLGPLAYPKYCEVIRRIDDNREEIVMVDLDKIASGEQPDFFIKPNDLINVGTHPTSRWRAVLRNAFRAAYGFGFVYDRNFAYSDDRYGTNFF